MRFEVTPIPLLETGLAADDGMGRMVVEGVGNAIKNAYQAAADQNGEIVAGHVVHVPGSTQYSGHKEVLYLVARLPDPQT